mgnify:CR=1 FL=1
MEIAAANAGGVEGNAVPITMILCVTVMTISIQKPVMMVTTVELTRINITFWTFNTSIIG